MSPEKKLSQFVVLGSESAIYSPRPYGLSMIPSTLSCVEELVANSKEEQIVAVLIKAANNELTNPFFLADAAAICVKSDSLSLKRAVYSNFSLICLNSQVLFNFVRLLRDVARSFSIKKDQKLGCWGEGVRNALKKWYASKDTKTLARILATEKSFKGWSHRDILKQIHFKATSPEVDAVIQYFAFGKGEAREALDEDSKLLANKLEQLKTGEDGLQAAALLSQLKLLPPAIPPRFRNSAEVWTEYIRSLPLADLLQRLEYFTSSKSLSAAVLPTIITLFREADGSSIDPGEVFVALRHYEICNHHMRKEKAIAKKREAAALHATVASTSEEAVKKGKKGTVCKVAPKPCPKVVAAVQGLLTRSIAALPPGQEEWLIVLDFPEGGATSCMYRQAVSTGGAAALTAVYAKRVGRAVTVIASGVDIVQLETDADVIETAATFRNVKTEEKGVEATLEWALTQKSSADTVVVLTHSQSQCVEILKKTQVVMESYREKAAKPEARLIIMFLRQHGDSKCNDDPNTLATFGFAGKTVRIVTAFSRGEI